MGKEIKDILSIYENILSNKSLLKEANLFGGSSFKWGGGPSDHSKRPLGNWQSDNAWDIMAAEGTPVYSISDGTVSKVSGSDTLSSNGVVYGYNVTVNTGNNEIFYTHLGSLAPGMKENARISKGDLVGNIGKPKENPNWPTHVHIGVKSGNIDQFINGQAEIVGASNVSTSGSTSTSTSGTTQGKYDIGLPPGYTEAPAWAKTVAQTFKGGLKESLNEAASDEIYYLVFCNISEPTVRNGQDVSVGTVLGKTSEDVEVSKYDYYKTRTNIKKNDYSFGKDVQNNIGNVIIPSSSNPKIKSPVSGRIVNISIKSSCKNQIVIQLTVGTKEKSYKSSYSKEPTFKDPALGALLTLPTKIFKDKYDDSGNLKQKRFGYPGEKVDPWIKDAIVAPFKEIGKLFRKENNEEDERKKKKVDENVEKIKRLLK